MLSPEEIAAIGVQVALAARSTEGACVSELCKVAVKALEDGPDLGRAVTASASVPGVIVGTIASHPYMSAPSVSRQVADALSRSAGRDASALGVSPEELAAALAPGHDPVTAADAVATNLKVLAARDNLAMGEDARRTFVSAVSRWVPAASRGEVAYEECVRRIVEECAKRGVKVVDYASGRRTSIDVAARRHVVTQVQQAAASRSLAASASMGEGLVFVTSHVGARPSHREWQGKPFAAHGPLTVDGVTYQDLAEATGYGTPGGLCGANCSHSFGPWLHWQKPPYSHTPDEDAGLDPDEAYVATQAQRSNERAIRQAKLEADALREAGQDDAAARLRLGRAQASQRKLLSDHRWIKRRPERETAYGKDGRAVSVRPLRVAKASGKPSGGTKRRDVKTAMECEKAMFVSQNTGDAKRNAENATLVRNFSKVRPTGAYDVKCHGSSASVKCFNSDIDARTLARIIRGRKDYGGGDVRLLACSTGKIDSKGSCIAQELADRLGVTVTAPNDTLYVVEDGSMRVGDEGRGAFVSFHPRSAE
ncbi:MAG: hypothetical protein PUG08_03385 [Parafannyhessea umbonata]|uniref:phage minor capsid protein n=1 Tax=Parafannyhessea umbonata TaxID=604330 RepID=UPI0026EFFA1F|nr:phage minor capsid protein [Parafannyhessea umbonata]MDD6358987.1 hypothetical protein [Parafannyhessea umbonata]MDD6600885.1 hypothetical protein [Parafannyhessea umbonata]